MQKTIVGIPWYTREDYPAILGVMSDAGDLPDTYREWRKKAKEVELAFTDANQTYYRIPIDPLAFPVWCVLNNRDIDAKARADFAAEAALKLFKLDDQASDEPDNCP